MDEHDSHFQNQALFNFDSSRTKLRNAMSVLAGRATRSLAADLDVGLAENIIESLDYKQLSRYVIEDVLKCQVGHRFLACIAKDLDTHHHKVLSQSAKIQLHDGIGGEEVRITGDLFTLI